MLYEEKEYPITSISKIPLRLFVFKSLDFISIIFGI